MRGGRAMVSVAVAAELLLLWLIVEDEISRAADQHSPCPSCD